MGEGATRYRIVSQGGVVEGAHAQASGHGGVAGGVLSGTSAGACVGEERLGVQVVGQAQHRMVASQLGVHLHRVAVGQAHLGRAPRVYPYGRVGVGGLAAPGVPALVRVHRGVVAKRAVAADEAEAPLVGRDERCLPEGTAPQTRLLPQVARELDLSGGHANLRLARARRHRNAGVHPAPVVQLVEVHAVGGELCLRQVAQGEGEVAPHAQPLCQVVCHGAGGAQAGGRGENALSRVEGGALHADASVALKRGEVGQHHVGQARRLAHAHVDGHEQLELAHELGPGTRVAVAHHGVGRVGDEAVDLSQLNGLADGGAQALLGVHEGVALRARLGHLGHGGRREALGVEGAQRQLEGRVEVAALLAIVAEQGVHQGDHASRLRGVDVGDAQPSVQAAIHHRARSRLPQAAGDLHHVVGVDAAGVCAPCGGVGAHGLGELLEPCGVAGYELLVVEVLLDEHMRQAQQKGQVGAGTQAHPLGGLGAGARTARVNGHHLAAAYERGLEDVHRVRVARIEGRAPQEDDVVGVRQVGLGGVSQRVVPAGETRVLAGTHLGVHVGRAERGKEPVEVHARPRRDARGAGQGRCPVALDDAADALGDAGVGLVVARGLKLAGDLAAYERAREPVGVEVGVETATAPAAQAGGAVGVPLDGHKGVHSAVLVDVRTEGAVGVAAGAHRHYVVVVRLGGAVVSVQTQLLRGLSVSFSTR